MASIEELIRQHLLFSSPSSSSNLLRNSSRNLEGSRKGAVVDIWPIWHWQSIHTRYISHLPVFLSSKSNPCNFESFYNFCKDKATTSITTFAWTKQILHRTIHNTLYSTLYSSWIYLLDSWKNGRRCFNYLRALQLFRNPSWRFEYKGESGLQVIGREEKVD